MNKQFIWLAVGKNGGYQAFRNMPVRDKETGEWCGERYLYAMPLLARMESVGFRLPDMTSDSNPVKLTITLDYEVQ